MTAPRPRWLGWLYGLLGTLIALCLSPIAALVWVSWFAGKHGCRVDEAGIYPCIVDGHDYGTTLAGLGMTGWALILTLPLAALLTAVLLGILLVRALLRWRRGR